MAATLPGDPLHICLASWAPIHAGAEVAAERLAVGLTELGHQVSVVLGTEGETLESMRGVGLDVTHIPLALTDKWKPWGYWRARGAMTEYLSQRRPDLLHSNDLPSHQMVSEAGRRSAVPRISHHRFVFDGAAIDWMNKFGAERHVFVSDALRKELCGNSRLLAAAPGDVLYDGLPIPSIPSDLERAQARVRLGVDANKVLVLFAGQIIERKGVADLLQAWAALPEPIRGQAELRIVGDDLLEKGSYRKKMELFAQEHGVMVRFMGFQRNVPEWLTAADIAVVPSHVEPLGNATLEAMAHARPVIGTRVGGIPEMISHRETGLLVEPHNPADLAAALECLISERPERERLGAGARERCERQFSLRAHALSAVAQYAAVLSGLDASRAAATS